jgi:hypothetical protein
VIFSCKIIVLFRFPRIHSLIVASRRVEDVTEKNEKAKMSLRSKRKYEYVKSIGVRKRKLSNIRLMSNRTCKFLGMRKLIEDHTE